MGEGRTEGHGDNECDRFGWSEVGSRQEDAEIQQPGVSTGGGDWGPG